MADVDVLKAIEGIEGALREGPDPQRGEDQQSVSVYLDTIADQLFTLNEHVGSIAQALRTALKPPPAQESSRLREEDK